jgi:hypothetical protein
MSKLREASCKEIAMLFVDTPSQQEFRALNAERADACVSIYLPTTPLTADVGANRIEYGNLVKEALRQLQENGFLPSSGIRSTSSAKTMNSGAYRRIASRCLRRLTQSAPIGSPIVSARSLKCRIAFT